MHLRVSMCLLSSGEGMFGKVYTAVNMDTGAYMAMKEVSDDHYKFEVNIHDYL